MNPVKKTIAVFPFLLASLICMPQSVKNQNEKTDILLQKLRKAESPFKINLLINKISKLNIAYDSVVENIRLSNYLPLKVQTGFLEWNYKLDSLKYVCYVFVPANYIHTKKYQVSFVLHGAVMSPNPEALRGFLNKDSYNVDSLERIIVYPAGWVQSPWWDKKQITNLNFLIRKLKLDYNIDENNIQLSGVSDGGTAIVYQASLNPTPWSNLRHYISSPMILDRLSDNTIYLKNLNNKPSLFISTDKDQLYPPYLIKSFLMEMDKANNPYVFYLAEGYKHEISWITEYRDSIENFNTKNPREPYPSEIFLETNSLNYNRNHWLVLEKFVTNPQLPKETYPFIYAFKDTQNTIPGVLNARKTGNNIYVDATNVSQYTVLLSPDQFNFEEEITVYTNNDLSFKGRIEKDIKILLKWYNKDLDRSMLFGNELIINIGGK